MESSIQEQNHQQRLKGKVAIITGGAKGIGAATAKLFAHHGAHVIIADIQDSLGTNLANSINARYIHCDVSKESDVESAVQLALSWKGKLNIMFNNAGIFTQDCSITNLDTNNLQSLLNVNLLGVIHGTKHAAKAMIESNTKGSIICTSSTAAIMGGLASHAYTMSKGAIISVMRSLACELGNYGIRVNCISPHGVATDMLLDAHRKFSGDMEMEAEKVAELAARNGSLWIGRGGRVEDVAGVAVFLGSDEGEFITGQNFVVDGGYTCATTTMRSFVYQVPINSSM